MHLGLHGADDLRPLAPVALAQEGVEPVGDHRVAHQAQDAALEGGLGEERGHVEDGELPSAPGSAAQRRSLAS